MSYVDELILKKREQMKMEAHTELDDGLYLNGEPGKVTERVMSVIHRNNPDYQIYPYEVLEKINGCWFAFRSHAMDSDMYNMMLLVPVGKKLVLVSFNCSYKDCQKWKKAVLMIWNTIMKVKVGL